MTEEIQYYDEELYELINKIEQGLDGLRTKRAVKLDVRPVYSQPQLF